jgi:hypothetical protein
MEVTEATGNALSHLEQAVDGLDGGVGQAGFKVGQNAVEVIFKDSGKFAEGFEPGEIPRSQLHDAIVEHVLSTGDPNQPLSAFFAGGGRRQGITSEKTSASAPTASEGKDSGGWIWRLATAYADPGNGLSTAIHSHLAIHSIW